MVDLIALGVLAKKAAAELNKLTDKKRSEALKRVAESLRENAEYLIKENELDIRLATE